jgi:N-acetylmuramoyl-L-alanine amidase
MRKYIRLSVVIVGAIMMSMHNCVAKSNNQLHKIYHHRGNNDSLELGQIVFYFAKDPHITMQQKKQQGSQKEIAFHFPGATMNEAAVATMHAFNRESNASYQATIKKRDDELVLALAYNPEKIAMEYESFTAITSEKGVTFRFYNKEVLSALASCKKSLLKTAYHVKPLIIIDCGHGGTDCGTRGCGAKTEKEVALDVGLELARLLRTDGFEVLLTRDADVTVALDTRTTFANMAKGSLLISIHANNAAKEDVSGIETFCLERDLFKHCFADINDCTLHSAHEILHGRNMHSNKLATCLHNNVLFHAKKKHAQVVDRRVKHSVSQILLGSAMPAVLVEIGFLSNKMEAALLTEESRSGHPSYAHSIAQGMRDGILEFRKNC